MMMVMSAVVIVFVMVVMPVMIMVVFVVVTAAGAAFIVMMPVVVIVMVVVIMVMMPMLVMILVVIVVVMTAAGAVLIMLMIVMMLLLHRLYLLHQLCFQIRRALDRLEHLFAVQLCQRRRDDSRLRIMLADQLTASFTFSAETTSVRLKIIVPACSNLVDKKFAEITDIHFALGSVHNSDCAV